MGPRFCVHSLIFDRSENKCRDYCSSSNNSSSSDEKNGDHCPIIYVLVHHKRTQHLTNDNETEKEHIFFGLLCSSSYFSLTRKHNCLMALCTGTYSIVTHKTKRARIRSHHTSPYAQTESFNRKTDLFHCTNGVCTRSDRHHRIVHFSLCATAFVCVFFLFNFSFVDKN